MVVYLNIWTSTLYQMHMPNHHIHENTGWFQITNTMLIIMIGVVGISVDIPTGIKVTYHNTIKKIKNRYDRY